MAKIDEAIEFLDSNVLQPALKNPQLSEKVKASIKHTRSWLPRFQRVGDLVAYMDRFQGNKGTSIYKGLKDADLTTFEDVHQEFMTKFGSWASERIRSDDFVVGQEYSGSHLQIFAGIYDDRSGGILPIGANGNFQSIIVKATLSGGKYDNQWISEPDVFKYYLKSVNSVFKEKFYVNDAIISNPHVPVLVFYRAMASGKFTFAGAFRNKQIHTEEDGAKWFELVSRSDGLNPQLVDEHTYRRELSGRVQKSLASTHEQRLKRLKAAPKQPLQVLTIGKGYRRNSDVVAEVLYRAGGICEGCNQSAPFARKQDGSPYLEVHHRIHLAEGGDDTVENAIALCPNCHRQEHHGRRLWR